MRSCVFILVLLIFTIIATGCGDKHDVADTPQPEVCNVTQLEQGIRVVCAESDQFFPYPEVEVEVVEVPVEVVVESCIEDDEHKRGWQQPRNPHSGAAR